MVTQLVRDVLAEQAAAAAAASGVSVRELESIEELSEADRLLSAIWEGDAEISVPSTEQPVSLLRALSHTGNYLAGAFRGSELVGATIGFSWGRVEASRLHSHIAGVTEGWQGKGIGFALKLHQRRWAADCGYEAITWSFDPLVRRNAWFNVMKLGATVEAYHPMFYGLMTDGLNGGDEGDRCLVSWPVDSRPPPSDGLGTAGARVLLSEGADGEPVMSRPAREGESVYLCQVPSDVVAMRRRDPALARRWRLALRETMGTAIEAGWVASRITRDGHYVLESGPK